MKLFTQKQYEQLLANGRQSAKSGEGSNHQPVVKLFTPDANATWLLSEIDPENPDTAFGLCDLGFGYPELGYVSLSELRGFRGRFGLPIERDLSFKPEKTLIEYAKEASGARRIV